MDIILQVDASNIAVDVVPAQTDMKSFRFKKIESRHIEIVLII